MPNKKKNKPVRNGYFYFMQDVREREAMKGKRFPSQKEVAEYCAPLWAKLMPQEKEEYNDLAKRLRLEEKNAIDETAAKLNSLGISIAHQDAEIREQEENEMIMNTHISNLMQQNGKPGIMTQTFYLCHVNYGFKISKNKYAPVELALAEFSLYDGIINRYHTFLQLGDIPLGLRYETIEWSNISHKIPINNIMGEKLDKKIFDSVVSFLSSRGRNKTMPVIYTMPDSLNSNDSTKAVVSAFEQLCEVAEKDPDMFRIYQLPNLFFALRNKIVQGGDKSYEFPSVALATGLLQNDVASSYSNMGCGFHVENDCELKCSLAAVTRWVYVICGYCCQYLGITVVPGKHIPVRESKWCIEKDKNVFPAVLPCVSPYEVNIPQKPKQFVGIRDSMWYEQTKRKYDKIREEKEEKERKLAEQRSFAINQAAVLEPEEVIEKLPSNYPEESFGYKYQEDEFPDLGGNTRSAKKENEKPRAWGNPWRK